MKVWPHGDPDRVVRDVLAQPAFRTSAPESVAPPQPSALAVLWGWFLDHVLRPLLHPIGRALGATHGAATIVGLALVTLALVAFAAVIFRLALAFARSDGRVSVRDAAAATPLAARRSVLAWCALAREAAARGEFRAAIAAWYAAALVTLDERSVVALDASRTPGEYRRLVRRARAAAAAPFDELAEGFVRAAYAREEPATADFEAAARAFAEFEPAVTR